MKYDIMKVQAGDFVDVPSIGCVLAHKNAMVTCADGHFVRLDSDVTHSFSRDVLKYSEGYTPLYVEDERKQRRLKAKLNS